MDEEGNTWKVEADLNVAYMGFLLVDNLQEVVAGVHKRVVASSLLCLELPQCAAAAVNGADVVVHSRGAVAAFHKGMEVVEGGQQERVVLRDEEVVGVVEAAHDHRMDLDEMVDSAREALVRVVEGGGRTAPEDMDWVVALACRLWLAVH